MTMFLYRSRRRQLMSVQDTLTTQEAGGNMSGNMRFYTSLQC